MSKPSSTTPAKGATVRSDSRTRNKMRLWSGRSRVRIPSLTLGGKARADRRGRVARTMDGARFTGARSGNHARSGRPPWRWDPRTVAPLSFRQMTCSSWSSSGTRGSAGPGALGGSSGSSGGASIGGSGSIVGGTGVSCRISVMPRTCPVCRCRILLRPTSAHGVRLRRSRAGHLARGGALLLAPLRKPLRASHPPVRVALDPRSGASHAVA